MTAKYPSRFRISAILAATYAICAVGSVHGSTSVEETWAQTSASQSAESQAAMTPAMALQFLKEGNERFRNRVRMNRQFIDQVKATGSGQYPFAAVLSCIDSRAPAELVFDQGIGDIFNIRVAGNTVNNDFLGRLEYYCKAA